MGDMTPKQMNEAVARKLGIKRLDNGMETKDATKNGYSVRAGPDYCGSIAGAWEVVDYISRHYHQMDLIHRGNFPQEGRRWTCYIGNKLFEWGPTAPMAICRAFLKLT